MNSKDKTNTLHALRYVQMILHTIPESEFNYFIGSSHLHFNSNSICSCLLVLLNDMNDRGEFKSDDMKKVCQYLKTDPQQSFESLERMLVNRAIGNHVALTLAETQRLLQVITYLIDMTNPCIKDNKISHVNLWLRGLLEFVFMRAEGLSIVSEPALS